MSVGDAVKIDADELDKLVSGFGRGLIAVKQGIINPSFMVSVVPDKDRIEKIYGDGSVAELPPLVNVFQGLKLQVADKMRQIDH